MNDEYMIRIITGSVVKALDPKFDSIHGRITECAQNIAKLEGTVSQMPKASDMHKTISEHSGQCTQRKQWMIGIFISIPATIGAAIALIKLFV